MNKKHLILPLMAGCLMLSGVVFAQEDFTQRNIFNHISDGMVTMFKSPDLKQHIIDERIQLRAERRKSSVDKKNKDFGPEKKYNDDMNDVNKKDAREKYENDRAAAMNAWQTKSDQEHQDLDNQRQADKQRIDAAMDAENRNYDKVKDDIRAQYQNDPDTMNAKLKDADNDHQMRVQDLNNQSKNDPAQFDAKQHDLDASLQQQKDDLNKQFDDRKAELQ